MSLKITQTCDKCKTERELPTSPSSGNTLVISPQAGGWRPFESKEVCANCIRTFLDTST